MSKRCGRPRRLRWRLAFLDLPPQRSSDCRSAAGCDDMSLTCLRLRGDHRGGHANRHEIADRTANFLGIGAQCRNGHRRRSSMRCRHLIIASSGNSIFSSQRRWPRAGGSGRPSRTDEHGIFHISERKFNDQLTVNQRPTIITLHQT